MPEDQKGDDRISVDRALQEYSLSKAEFTDAVAAKKIKVSGGYAEKASLEVYVKQKKVIARAEEKSYVLGSLEKALGRELNTQEINWLGEEVPNQPGTAQVSVIYTNLRGLEDDVKKKIVYIASLPIFGGVQNPTIVSNRQPGIGDDSSPSQILTKSVGQRHGPLAQHQVEDVMDYINRGNFDENRSKELKNVCGDPAVAQGICMRAGGYSEALENNPEFIETIITDILGTKRLRGINPRTLEEFTKLIPEGLKSSELEQIEELDFKNITTKVIELTHECPGYSPEEIFRKAFADLAQKPVVEPPQESPLPETRVETPPIAEPTLEYAVADEPPKPVQRQPEVAVAEPEGIGQKPETDTPSSEELESDVEESLSDIVDKAQAGGLTSEEIKESIKAVSQKISLYALDLAQKAVDKNFSDIIIKEKIREIAQEVSPQHYKPSPKDLEDMVDITIVPKVLEALREQRQAVSEERVSGLVKEVIRAEYQGVKLSPEQTELILKQVTDLFEKRLGGIVNETNIEFGAIKVLAGKIREELDGELFNVTGTLSKEEQEKVISKATLNYIETNQELLQRAFRISPEDMAHMQTEMFEGMKEPLLGAVENIRKETQEEYEEKFRQLAAENEERLSELEARYSIQARAAEHEEQPKGKKSKKLTPLEKAARIIAKRKERKNGN